MDNKWLNYLIYGGKIPTLDLPEVSRPIGFENQEEDCHASPEDGCNCSVCKKKSLTHD